MQVFIIFKNCRQKKNYIFWNILKFYSNGLFIFFFISRDVWNFRNKPKSYLLFILFEIVMVGIEIGTPCILKDTMVKFVKYTNNKCIQQTPLRNFIITWYIYTSCNNVLFHIFSVVSNRLNSVICAANTGHSNLLFIFQYK